MQKLLFVQAFFDKNGQWTSTEGDVNEYLEKGWEVKMMSPMGGSDTVTGMRALIITASQTYLVNILIVVSPHSFCSRKPMMIRPFICCTAFEGLSRAA
jgi:hypothetical protein